MRDMSDSQFKAALKRRGFRKVLVWFEHADAPNHSFGGVFSQKAGRLHRRATLAKIIKDLDGVKKSAGAS
ncbi:hypothetical protein [Ruegeria jejuensis]|uniref:hypothetical protein n=1 Tax=Ruegeria jejuensis TaxID=3233338 RepID=UPI00355AF67E